MACGLPIVTTRTTGAASSIVSDGGNGRVVEHSDVNALGDAIRSIVADDDLRARMGKESERIIAAWDVEHAAQNFGKLVSRLMSERRNAPAARRDVLNEQ
jgi:glycosyltransferase involved in cell wall biosynthesis